MLVKVLIFIQANFPLLMCILAILIALLNRARFNQRLFSCMMLFVIGGGGVYAFVLYLPIGLLALANSSLAPYPIEFELALVQLAIGIGGIIASLANWSFKAALSLIWIVLSWGAASWQVYQFVYFGYASSAISSSSLCSNILIPILLLILLALCYPKRHSDRIYY